MMRVLMVEASGRGFLSHYTHALSLGLHWAGIDVQLLTGKRDELKDSIVPFQKQACMGSGHFGWRCLRNHVTEKKPDIVHLQWVDSPFSAMQFVRWAKKRDVGVVYTPHNILPHERRWLLMPFYRALYRQMHKVVARDPHMAWALEELLDTPQGRVELLPGNPNALAIPALNQGVRSPCAKKIKGEQCLLFFGHGSTRKGLDSLLTTVSENTWPDHLHLVVAGEDVLQDISEELLSGARKSMHLTLIDRYLAPDEVAALFRDADLLLMPYIKLCKSPLLDLAAALRLPVLRSDRVQGADFREGLHGFTFSHTDLDAMGGLLKDAGWLENVKRNLGFLDDPAVAVNRLADGHKRLYLRIKDEVSQENRDAVYSEVPLSDTG